MKGIIIFLCFGAGLLLWQCSPGEAPREDDRLLAEVYNKNLYLSELEGIVPEGVSSEDSVLMVSAFTQRWVREQLLMYEAERNIPKDLDIDELVRNYRASLVRFNFEEKIIAEKLDAAPAPAAGVAAPGRAAVLDGRPLPAASQRGAGQICARTQCRSGREDRTQGRRRADLRPGCARRQPLNRSARLARPGLCGGAPGRRLRT